MLKVINVTDNCVHIRSNDKSLIISKRSFKRIKGRKARKAKIRHPIKVQIDGVPFIFTTKEWDRGECKALEHKKFSVDIKQVEREEILDKIKMSKKLGKQRALRLKMEADAAGSRIG